MSMYRYIRSSEDFENGVLPTVGGKSSFGEICQKLSNEGARVADGVATSADGYPNMVDVSDGWRQMVVLGSRKASFCGPADAASASVGLLFRESTPLPRHSGFANIFMGHEPGGPNEMDMLSASVQAARLGRAGA